MTFRTLYARIGRSAGTNIQPFVNTGELQGLTGGIGAKRKDVLRAFDYKKRASPQSPCRKKRLGSIVPTNMPSRTSTTDHDHRVGAAAKPGYYSQDASKRWTAVNPLWRWPEASTKASAAWAKVAPSNVPDPSAIRFGALIAARAEAA